MTTPRSSTHHGRAAAGFTLVEALMAATFLAVLFLAVVQTSSRASEAFDEGSTEHTLSTTTHRCLERMARAIELDDGSILAGGVTTAFGDDQVVFRNPLDFVGGNVVWGEFQIFAEREPGELDDGIDNDGDGLVDEFRVVLLEPSGVRLVLASGVTELLEGELPNGEDDNGNGLTDEAGLSFSAQGSVITLRLTCQRQDDGGRLLVKTAETAVRLRNTGG
jgi:hypothetical protein